jgi:transcriptional regulator with XRE-family HTH domain
MDQESCGEDGKVSRVGERLREIRKARRMSLETLGAHLHLTQAAISKMERGESKIDADILPRIAGILDVSPSAFYEEGKPSVVTSAVERAVQRAAQEAADLAVEKMRMVVREDLRAILAESKSGGENGEGAAA